MRDLGRILTPSCRHLNVTRPYSNHDLRTTTQTRTQTTMATSRREIRPLDVLEHYATLPDADMKDVIGGLMHSFDATTLTITTNLRTYTPQIKVQKD